MEKNQPKKIFTTDDNVDIFPGMKYYSVKIKEVGIAPLWSIAGPYINRSVHQPTGDLKFFYYKENAEDFVTKAKAIRKSDRVMAAAWALAANSTYGIPKDGKTSSLLDQQRVGRIERPKSMHNWGLSIDMAIGSKEAWAKSVDKIFDFDIINDLLNYKPKNKTMKQFKNRFAVKGDIINLLRFERELIKLNYENKDKPVIDYRSMTNEVANYITCGVHSIANRPGQFVAAANNGGADLIFNVDTDFEAAVEHASQLYPLFVTLDGTPIYSTDEKIYGIRKLNDEVYLKSNTNVYRGHYIITINYSNQKSDQYKWFGSVELAKQYIDNTVPLLTSEDGVPLYVNYQAYCVKPDFTSYFVKKGLDEKTPWPGCKYFNTDAAAQKYIDENKLQFSKKQIRDILINSTSTKTVHNPYGQNLRIHHIDGNKLQKAFNL